MEKTFITFEQASKLNKITPIAQQYGEMVQKIIYFFQKNSAAQFSNFDTYSRALDLSRYYYEKDYSNFLFDETKKLFDEFEKLQPDMIKFGEQMVRVAELTSKIELKEKWKCDGCGREVSGDKYPFYNENFVKQKGLSICKDCIKPSTED